MNNDSIFTHRDAPPIMGDINGSPTFSPFDPEKFNDRWKHALWFDIKRYGYLLSGILCVFYVVCTAFLFLKKINSSLYGFLCIGLVLICAAGWRYYLAEKYQKLSHHFYKYLAIQVELPSDDPDDPIPSFFEIITDEPINLLAHVWYLRDYNGLRYRLELETIADHTQFITFQPTRLYLDEFKCFITIPTICFSGTLDPYYPGTYHVTGIKTQTISQQEDHSDV